jgi:asparagine synthase (glutamine-hydrolysing)
MPGIVGLVTKMPRERAQAALQRMLATVQHEPFYEVGTWTDESLGVYLGWAVQKGSFAHRLPISNEKRDLTLIFSGEEFPPTGTIDSLKQRGHDFDPAGPEYLAHLCEEDPSFPAGLNGRFHGVVIDQAQRRAMLFNDRYGMQRVYFHEAEDGFYFAAEAKAILAARPGLRAMNFQSLGELVSCGCVLENRTIFKDIHVLPGAAAWTFLDGSLHSKGAYFQTREWEDQQLLEPEPYYEELREVFSRNILRYFGGSQQVGMSLTGGLDTRMVMAWEKCQPGSLPCYTFNGMFRECQDVVISREVARACEQSHQIIPVGLPFLSRFSHYAERTVYLTDGCADISRSPDLYANEKAREIAPVRMTGLYGGEVLRRVRAFKPVGPLEGLFSGEILPYLRGASDTYADVVRTHPLSFAAFRQAPWFYHGNLALEQTQLTMRTPFLDNDFIRTVYRAPASANESNDVCLRLIADGDARLGRIRTDRGLGGASGPVARAAQQAVLQFFFKAEYAYDYGMPQAVAKVDHFLSSLHLERVFLGRHKSFHFRVWYRDHLSEYLRDRLLDPRSLSRPYVERKKVEAVVNGHLTGGQNYTLEIHKLLTLELIHRLFVDQSPTSPR